MVEGATAFQVADHRWQLSQVEALCKKQTMDVGCLLDLPAETIEHVQHRLIQACIMKIVLTYALICSHLASDIASGMDHLIFLADHGAA